jgi:hypothetical protein
VADLGADAGRGGDVQHLVESGQQADAITVLIPQVARVDPAVAGHHPAQLD